LLAVIRSLAYIGCRAQLADSDLSKAETLTRLEITLPRFDIGGLLPRRCQHPVKYYPQAISDVMPIGVASDAWIN
jgi:hypothetical protein